MLYEPKMYVFNIKIDVVQTYSKASRLQVLFACAGSFRNCSAAADADGEIEICDPELERMLAFPILSIIDC